MPNFSIYHNPRCSKSRQALQLLQEKGVEPKIILYLKETPSSSEFKKVLAKLGLNPSDLLRRGEKVFQEKFKTLDLNEEEWLKVMLEYPQLIERPIVIRDNRAIVARPTESIEDLF